MKFVHYSSCKVLVLNLPGTIDQDPDDSFSKVPYEKGSLFLLYLESLVGGADAMRAWLQTYFTDFRTRTVDMAKMRAHFEAFMTKTLGAERAQKEVFDKIDWQTWLKGVGMVSINLKLFVLSLDNCHSALLFVQSIEFYVRISFFILHLFFNSQPPFDPTPLLDCTLAQACQSLAAKWQSADQPGSGCSAHDLKAFSSRQVMYFLDLLYTSPQPLSLQTLGANFCKSYSW